MSNQKRSLRFDRPADQIFLMLPSIAMLLCSGLLGYFLVRTVSNHFSVAMLIGGVPEVTAREALDASAFLFKIYWVVTALLGLVGFLWAWRISRWIFGPYTRLEKALIEIKERRMDPAQLRVRDEDALFPIVELFRQAILALRK